MLPARTALALSNHALESVEAVDLASPPRPRWARGGVLSQAGDDTIATSCGPAARPREAAQPLQCLTLLRCLTSASRSNQPS